jgi:hypothetical protein
LVLSLEKKQYQLKFFLCFSIVLFFQIKSTI